MTIKGEFFGKIVTYLFSSIFLVSSSKSKLCFRTPCSGSSLSRRFSSAAAAALYYQHYGGFVQLPFPPTTKNSWLCAYIKWLLLPSSNNIVVECKNTLSHATQSCEAFSFQMPLQSMTCYLFWVAAPATPQPKISPQPHATCFFWWSQLASASATLSKFSFNFCSIIY